MILKWAGGKSWLIKKIVNSLPNYENYIEPFLGGGSFFYYLQEFQDTLGISKKGYISDINPHLINFFKELKVNPKKLYKKAEKLVNKHNEFTTKQEHEKNYFDNRELFREKPSPSYFLYLNKLCFNGLYREGPQGFNVPLGFPISKWNHSLEQFLKWQKLLKNFDLNACSFLETLKKANDGDLIYLDPPYVDRSDSENQTFRGYNKKEFNEDDLAEMSKAVKKLNPKCKILISNFNEYHATKFFKKSDGWIKTPLAKKYAISGISEGVFEAKEVLISNFKVEIISN